ncbi:hypothetical protein [Plantibacter sp. MMLR14_011]|uniref:hypothetical protein n=1 Tax=Plantibacter sp. MMLR14_011 TaxID=1898746 RepID=UPI0008DD1F3A|nr:hypothetical protein [Plantibacter sp. MMLR14_011]OII43242.1 hypothetical protein BIU99_00220 [Plantibacter sp. MMLR14_011]
MTASLTALAEELTRRGLVVSPEIEDTFVYGLARFDAIDAEVMLNVDPEPEEQEGEPEPAALADLAQRVLSTPVAEWKVLLDRVASEIEEAVESDEVIETADLRDDLVLRSVIVFIDAVLLSFDAPKQFPDSSVLVQLDADLAFEAVEVEPDEDDEEGVESIKFSTVEELVRRLSM